MARLTGREGLWGVARQFMGKTTLGGVNRRP